MCGLNTAPVYNSHGLVLEWSSIGQDQCPPSHTNHTSHSPPALQDVSFVLTDITSSYISQSGTKVTHHLNVMVHLFHNPDMDRDAVGDSLLKEPELFQRALWKHISKVSSLKMRSYYFAMNTCSLASEKQVCKL